TLASAYDIPKIEVQISANLALASGLAYAPQIQVTLPQGRRTVSIDVPGSYRTPHEEYMHLRVSKLIHFGSGGRRAELGVELRNLLQEQSKGVIASTIFGSATFGQLSSWATPRQLMFRARVFF